MYCCFVFFLFCFKYTGYSPLMATSLDSMYTMHKNILIKVGFYLAPEIHIGLCGFCQPVSFHHTYNMLNPYTMHSFTYYIDFCKISLTHGSTVAHFCLPDPYFGPELRCLDGVSHCLPGPVEVSGISSFPQTSKNMPMKLNKSYT